MKPFSMIAVAVLTCAGAYPGASDVAAQSFPSKPVRLLTTAAGGGLDLASRIIAQGLAGPLGQPVIVDNRGSIVASEALVKATPDGYTLLYNANILWLLPFMRDHVPWDPVRDLSPITLAVSAPNLIVAHPALPTKTIRDLIVLARLRPGELNYASGNAGSSNDLAAELFKSMANIKIVRIGYRGGGPALNDLIGGHLQLSFSTASAVTSHVKAGKLRALGITSLQQSALLPDVPTVAAAGLPGYEAVSTQGLFAPAGTPNTLLNLLSQEISRVLARADIRQRFMDAGAQTVGSTPEQFAMTIKLEMARWGKVIKDAGIRADD